MKKLLKMTILSACALPVVAQASLPQALVLTCGGAAPRVLHKTKDMASFACANGNTPQAVGVVSGMGGLVGLASGAGVVVESEAVSHFSLPGTGFSGPVDGGGSSVSGSHNGLGEPNGSNANGSGENSGGQSGGGASSGNGGGFLGDLFHAVGKVAQNMLHVTVNGSPVLGSASGGSKNYTGNTASGEGNTGNTASGQFQTLNQVAHGPAQNNVGTMDIAPAGYVELSGVPNFFNGHGDRALVQWISHYEGRLRTGWILNTVIHPESIIDERLPAGGSGYYPYQKMTGAADFYLIGLNHNYIAYPGNPVRFTVQIETGDSDTQAGVWEGAEKVQIQAITTYSSGPAHYTSNPGNRNGPFWPSPFTLGGPEPIVAAACHAFTEIDHVSEAGFCWSSHP